MKSNQSNRWGSRKSGTFNQWFPHFQEVFYRQHNRNMDVKSSVHCVYVLILRETYHLCSYLFGKKSSRQKCGAVEHARKLDEANWIQKPQYPQTCAWQAFHLLRNQVPVIEHMTTTPHEEDYDNQSCRGSTQSLSICRWVIPDISDHANRKYLLLDPNPLYHIYIYDPQGLFHQRSSESIIQSCNTLGKVFSPKVFTAVSCSSLPRSLPAQWP